MMRLMLIIKAFYRAARDTIEHDGIEHAGYLAFLAILSIFPFLVIFTAMLGLFGASSSGAQLIAKMIAAMPSDMVSSIMPRIEEITSGPPQSLLTISIIGAIWTSSSMLDGLRTILNRAYRVTSQPTYMLRRLVSVAELILLTGILVAVMLFLIIAPILLEKLGHVIDINLISYYLLIYQDTLSFLLKYQYITIYFVLFLVIIIIYMTIPNISHKILDIVPGAATSSFGWIVAGSGLSRYVSDFHQVHLIYGSLGGTIAVLLFFYLSASILIFGAELNYHLHNRKSSG